MQIVVPMSGFGERFRKAGYSIPKPLIDVDGKPIVAHVIDMFPGEKDFIFICNQEHLDEPSYEMASILKKYCPTGRIVGIPSHKLGPIYAVLQAIKEIDLNQPVVVNYCDFTCFWNWDHFKKFVSETACMGAIPAYRGFHPHSLGSTNYAYIQEVNGWVLDIQEKQPYTNDRMNEFASSGTYYFASAKLMKDAFERVVDKDLNVGGEFYVSLAYKPLLENHTPIAVYPIQHFMQWGTPEDLAEYRVWSDVFMRLIKPASDTNEQDGALIMPMAGLGQRFKSEGYKITKPLIPVSGVPMVAQAMHDLPQTSRQVFVLREDMPGYQDVVTELVKKYPNSIIKIIQQVTEGQACTALIGLDALQENNIESDELPVTIGACDNGMLYSATRLQDMILDPKIDVIVWGVRGHPNAIRHPKMFGWISEQGGKISSISVKESLVNPKIDPIVLGTFTFKRAKNFRKAVNQLIGRNGTTNGEFYIDAAINDAIALGLNCYLFEVDSYLSWGTPSDLQTFEYWQSCFHKWGGHHYRLECDSRIPLSRVRYLQDKYREIIPVMP
ncbi:NTP transferase domain-containing protein [Polynucleobacter sp. 73C-SIWE]|uniref:NTP transferase domain-containing protein n=1 Tax=Polynucleobacter sp. 73C-SIWE TaxID=2689098 RepID=UPI001C0AC33D|nr:NTP transferase domain-containing protein [Polynucleobacter sp. 73C-SIWE]MBU3578657.1 NTP transferase domain-containing protein [Polynucleobacter sp. 73C-SIWE]